MPTLVVIAGPNGCGKSTLTRTRRFNGLKVLDPDAIARGLRTGNPIEAGREALRQRREALRRRESFAVETTLSGRSMLATIREARNAGYRIEVHYTCVGSAEQALDRIRTRVAQGGHDIPEEDAKRRFARSLEQLPEVMIEANETYLYDNSIRHAPHRQVAVIGVGMGWAAAEVPDWAANAIQKATDRSRNDGESEEYARRSDRALRIHDARSRHSEPSVRADAHVHIAGLTPDADTAAQKLREAVNSDLTIRNESSLNRRLMAIATEIEGGGRSDRRDDAIKAAESKETRSEAREAALRRPPWETASGGDEPSREPTERPPRRRKPQERER